MLKYFSALFIVYLLGDLFEYNHAFPRESLKSDDDDFRSQLSRLNPCQDFYKFACLRWTNSERAPVEDEYKYSVFIKQGSIVRQNILNILASRPNADDPEPLNQARQFYSDCINTDKLDKRGYDPLVQLTENLGGWPMLNNKPLENITVMEAIMRFKNNSIWDKDVGFFHNRGLFHIRENQLPDIDTNFTLYPPFILWDHLNLEPFGKTNPYKSYSSFLNEVLFEIQSEESFPYLYKDILVSINNMIKFETRLVRSLNEENFESKHNRLFTVKEFQSFFDNCPVNEMNHVTRVDWLTVLKEISPAVEVNENTYISVGFPYFFQELGSLLHKSKVDAVTVRNFMIWTAVSPMLSETTTRMRKIQRDSNQTTDATRENICSRILLTDTKGPFYALINAVGYEYAKRLVPPEEKLFVSMLLEDIREAFIKLIFNNTWMDEFTKTNLEARLRSFQIEVAYPDWILNKDLLTKYYEGLIIEKGKHFENYLALVNFQATLRPPNVRKFSDSSQTSEFLSVSPSYDPIANVLAVPAGQLGDPYYNQEAGLSAANFGSIGSLIGHEMSHIIITSLGNVSRSGDIQVWSNESATTANDNFNCYSDLYRNLALDANVVSTGTTLEEDISDNLGFAAAYSAYRAWKENKISKGQEAKDNTENDQQFYLSYAQVWCANTKDDLVLWKSVHSPDKVRVWGVIGNSQYFGKDWDCPIGTSMNPKNKCSF
ncbi:unnamed protein product [Allacma fusca]|uniref:Endothelin-converting enzyme 1 n=1 Tax=Allacma fusca TaxID=39272 RepID=A0A8J2K3Q2_9HEXA|nr:unnamed protein product [Allacma fusca]